MMKNYIVTWVIENTEYQGESIEPMTKKAAEKWRDEMNVNNPGIRHEIKKINC